MQKSNFKDWSRAELDDTFNLTQVQNLTALDEWIAVSQPMTLAEFEQRQLVEFRRRLLYRGDDWNEIELIEHFIAPIMAIVNFNTEEFGMFSGRTMTAVVGDYELSGEPDAVIAKGRRYPKIPFFCFHEYKKEAEPKGDPAGQALVAMLVAQELNKHCAPVYGLYVSGTKWRFMVLQGKEYALSVSYPADRDELFDILKMLKRLKQIIEQLVHAPASAV